MKRLLIICLGIVLLQSLSGCAKTNIPTVYIPSDITADEPMLPTNQLASFSVTELSVFPSQVQAGTAAEITIRIKNTGGTHGEYLLTLEIDGAKQAEKAIGINAGATESVSYSVTLSAVGDHTIIVDNKSITLNVVHSALREFNLNQAESYQQMASSELTQANSCMDSANNYLQLAQNTSGDDTYYRTMYQNYLGRYQQHMEQWAFYKQQADEYMEKAQAQP